MSDWKEEYRECGTNFRAGFQLIFDISKTAVAINTFLFAAYAAISQFLDPVTNSQYNFSLSKFLICVIGILSSIGFTMGHYRMAHYVRDFLKRASEIEKSQSFELYTRASQYELEGRRTILNAYYIPMFAYIIVALVWVLLVFISVGLVNIKMSM